MGSIDLDPASSAFANTVVGAARFYTMADDGLRQRWHGNVWMNPPYVQPVMTHFSEAVSDKFDAKEIRQACVLVNNATETSWFQRLLASASAICFIRGRIRFLDERGEPVRTPLQGQAVFYLGPERDRFRQYYTALGAILFKP
jgi:hypothetical protein